jgi:hypothetical protein
VLHQVAANPSTLRLFTVAKDDIRQVALIPVVDDVGGAQRPGRVEAHIQGAGLQK